MTDIAKAIAFATHCLKWPNVAATENMFVTLICHGGNPILNFNPNRMEEVTAVLQEFLSNRFYIQINRGTHSLFHWRVIVGVQNLSVKGACLDQAIGVGDDLWDAIFDACVQAAAVFEKP
jgi:hypothetical protein